ncbi:helix-turn-helix domain-containing protein [Bradyrhizobium manausense]|nr:helix-turn-helix domain-containing protein [Bradyrhizobium manausense]UVO33551.1 helix-turn-helix domain-containing protein [Bradyrhizobium arachidis]
MGPIRYLALRRMRLARRAVVRSDPSRTTVTKIVSDHGFWELGRFSVAYRMLFGESPSCTLQRPADNPGDFLNRPSSLAAADARLATVPGKGYFAILRLYGPTEAAFDNSWKPGDLVKMN